MGRLPLVQHEVFDAANNTLPPAVARNINSKATKMTPEEYERAYRKLVRYGEHFDISVDSKLPQPVVKTKAGKVAKRQPPYDERPKSYYQAQCSFRGLKTSGGKDELQ